MITAVLTIDDIASKNTPAIVDYLREKDIQAVMFAVAEWAEANYEEAVYTVKNGMILGNHSATHPSFSQISLEAGVREIERCEETLARIYRDAGVERVYRPFRFPYGDKGGANKAALQQYLKEQGFNKLCDTQIPYPWWKHTGLDKDVDTLWTYDFEEYRIRQGSDFTAEDAMRKIHRTDAGVSAPLLADGGSHILLLHAHDETDAMFPGYYKAFIEELSENGVTFTRPSFL